MISATAAPTAAPPTQKIIKQAGMDGGTATGLAFGILFAGIVLAVVGIFVYSKVVNSPSQNRYQHHRDEE